MRHDGCEYDSEPSPADGVEQTATSAAGCSPSDGGLGCERLEVVTDAQFVRSASLSGWGTLGEGLNTEDVARVGVVEVRRTLLLGV